MQTSAGGSINSNVFEIKRHVGMRVYFRDQIHMGNKRLIDVQRKQMCVGDKEENYRHCVCVYACQTERGGKIFGGRCEEIEGGLYKLCKRGSQQQPSVWPERGSSTSDEHFTRSRRPPFFLLPLFRVSQ